MTEIEINCTFCTPEEFTERMIRSGELVLSLVSNPRFREGHCLVVPRRHVEHIDDLSLEEGGAITREIGRLARRLDVGFGSGVMWKYDPTLDETNGIKKNHIHAHVFPRIENEAGLFPVPQPNNYNGLAVAGIGSIRQLAESLR